MAFAALDKAAPNNRYKQIAVDTFNNIIARKDNSKGSYNKNFQVQEI
jgi:N-acylglucosamine 2-epimerase